MKLQSAGSEDENDPPPSTMAQVLPLLFGVTESLTVLSELSWAGN